MKFEEKIATKYFDSLNFESIEYEPIGNTPPDFLLNNSIAVEVRRLNKFHDGIPLEKLEFNVVRKITNLINEYCDNTDFDQTCLVSIAYQRPLQLTKDLKRKIQEVLSSNFKSVKYDMAFNLSNNLTLNFYPNSEKRKNQFEVVGWIDMNRGGFVVSDLCNSLEIILEEKEKKVKNYFNKYDEWWLVLIDHISYGNPSTLIPESNRCLKKGIIFKKLVFVSPINYKHNYEIITANKQPSYGLKSQACSNCIPVRSQVNIFLKKCHSCRSGGIAIKD
jgi:hypothetical protein